VAQQCAAATRHTVCRSASSRHEGARLVAGVGDRWRGPDQLGGVLRAAGLRSADGAHRVSRSGSPSGTSGCGRSCSTRRWSTRQSICSPSWPAAARHWNSASGPGGSRCRCTAAAYRCTASSCPRAMATRLRTQPDGTDVRDPGRLRHHPAKRPVHAGLPAAQHHHIHIRVPTQLRAGDLLTRPHCAGCRRPAARLSHPRLPPGRTTGRPRRRPAR